MRPPFLPRDDDYSGLFAFLAALAAVAIGFLFLAHAAFAQEPNAATKEARCQTLEQHINAVNALPAEIRNTLHIRILDGSQAQAWVSAVNAIPPVSDIKLDRLALIARDGNGFVVVVVERGGCVVGANRMTTQIHKRILKDANLEQGQVM